MNVRSEATAAEGSVRRLVKRWISPETRNLIRRKQARLRWIHKYRRARSFGASLQDDPQRLLTFVLLEPEVENFTYEISNQDELATFLAGAIGARTDEIAGYMSEASLDPELSTELTRRVRWRWDAKRHLPLGRRLGWYALVRSLRPGTVVETGIHAGLGSLALLRALDRNAREGAGGELISFDVLKNSGWLIPPHLRHSWQPVFESTFTALDRTVKGRSVDLLIQDLGAGYQAELHDYETVAHHGADRLVLVAASAHLTTALRDFANRRGVSYHHFRDVSSDHVFPGSATGIAVLDDHASHAGD